MVDQTGKCPKCVVVEIKKTTINIENRFKKLIVSIEKMLEIFI